MNIVLVDDNLVNLKLIEGLLKKCCPHYAPVSFQDPAGALAWCESHIADLLIVDYMMPAMDGIEFIRRFRTLPDTQQIPVLMVTADGNKSTRLGALEAGANDFLTKPIESVEFSVRVRNMLLLGTSFRTLSTHASQLAREVELATGEIHEREREIVQRLARAAETRDPETGGHILRMANYSRLIAEELGLPDDQQKLMLNASPMHDIGKIAIPDHILLKPGRLTEAEFEVMKTHAAAGWRILRDSSSPLLQAAAVIALNHHEKWDGSGYPNQLAGEQIPLLGRITAAADVFDALTSARPYKPAWEMERAFAFFRDGSGTHFDPGCVEALFARRKEILDIHTRYRDENESKENAA